MRGPRETSCEYLFELCTEHHPVSRLQRKDLRYTGQSIDFLYLQRQKVRAFCEIRWYHGTWLPSYKKGRGQVFLMLRLSNSEAVRACTKRLLNFECLQDCESSKAAKQSVGHQVMGKSFLTMTSF